LCHAAINVRAYDKNGNRTNYDKNVAGGYTSSYGKQYNLSYTFDSVNSISAISDVDDASYSCSVTSDANLKQWLPLYLHWQC
jgi:hypothetical protein